MDKVRHSTDRSAHFDIPLDQAKELAKKVGKEVTFKVKGTIESVRVEEETEDWTGSTVCIKYKRGASKVSVVTPYEELAEDE